MKHSIIIISVLFIAIPIISLSQEDAVQITTDGSSQMIPAVYDSLIVWMDLRHQSGFTPDAKIYMYDLTSEMESVVDYFPYHQSSPDVWEHRIVWQERKNIYMYDLLESENIAVCSASGIQSFPKIEGNYIVWHDDRSSSNTDIYLYDIADDTTIQITDNTEIRQEYPDVSGNLVIWLQNDSLYVHDLSDGSTYPIKSEYVPQDPAISGTKIVYRCHTDVNYQIFVYDLETGLEQQITSGNYMHMNPAISSIGIVWEDYRDSPDSFSNPDLYLYDLSTGIELPICTEESRQTFPAIWENRIVWTDDRNENNDIYMTEYNVPTGADLEVKMTDDPDPVEAGYYVNFTIEVTNEGPQEATNVKLDVLLPGNLEFTSIVASNGDCSQFASTGSCELGDLAKGETAVITLVAIAGGLDAVNTTATVTSDLEDPNPVNNSFTENTIVSQLARKYVNHGWLPHIALDAMDMPHLSYTYKWYECFLHYANTVEGVGGDDIKHAWDVNGAWNKEIIYDGRWYSNTPPIPTQHIDLLGRTSDITIDNDNVSHVVYAYEHTGYFAGNPIDDKSYIIKYRKNDGEGWSYPEELMELQTIVDRTHYTNAYGGPRGVWAPNILTDSNGGVHITFMDCGGIASQAPIYYLTNVSGDWVTTTIGTAYDFLDMVLDSNDRLHLSYYSIDVGGITYLTNSPDGQWQSPEIVEEGWMGVQLEGMCTGIAVDPLNRPHIVYAGQTENNHLEDVKYAWKDNEQWQIEKVHEGLNQSAHNSIAVDANSNPHLCYFSMADERLVYAVKSGDNWTKTILDDMGQNWNDITVTSEGKAHITYTNDKIEESGKIYYASNREFVDSDLDGIADNNEQGADGTNPAYDGDGNGMPDYQQKNAASFLTSDGQNYITIVCDDSLILSDVSYSNNPSPNDAPDAYWFPFGSFSFTLLGLVPGDSTTVDLILPENSGADTYFKYGAQSDSIYDHWYEFLYDGYTGAQFNDNIITLHLIDGQRGDNDLTANGIICEPGLPANQLTAIKDLNGLNPTQFDLSQNYPNPFNNETRIVYSVAKISRVELTIYNVIGQKIHTLIDEVKSSGKIQHQLGWEKSCR